MLEAILFLTLLAVDRDPSGLSSSITCRARIATCTTTLSMSSAEDYCDGFAHPFRASVAEAYLDYVAGTEVEERQELLCPV